MQIRGKKERMSVYYSLSNLSIFQSIYVPVYIYTTESFLKNKPLHTLPRHTHTYTLQQQKHEETRSGYKKLRSRLTTLTAGFLLWKKTGCPAGKIPNQERNICRFLVKKEKGLTDKPVVLLPVVGHAVLLGLCHLKQDHTWLTHHHAVT